MVVALWSGRRLSRTEGALFVCSEVSRWTLGLLRIFGWSRAAAGAIGALATPAVGETSEPLSVVAWTV